MPFCSSVGLRPASHSSSSSTSGCERQRARQFEPLLVDIGQLRRPARRPCRPRPTRVEQRARAALAPRRPTAAARGRPARRYVLQRSRCAEHAHQLEGARDAALRDAVRRQRRDRRGRRADLAAVGRDRAGDQVEHRGLARAVRADQAEDLAAAHSKPRPSTATQAAERLAHAQAAAPARRRSLRAAARGQPSRACAASADMPPAGGAGAAPALASSRPSTPLRQRVDDQHEDQPEQDAEIVREAARSATRTAAPAARRRAPAPNSAPAPPNSAMMTTWNEITGLKAIAGSI